MATSMLEERHAATKVVLNLRINYVELLEHSNVRSTVSGLHIYVTLFRSV